MNGLLKFIKSEKGVMDEWLVGVLIIGLGSIPVIIGIAQAYLEKMEECENAIRSVIWMD